MEDTTEIKDVKDGIKVVKAYPMVEEMTFRGIVKSEEQAYALLTSVQILVNELGTETILEVMDAIKNKPSLMQKAKSYLPYIKLL